MEKYNGYANYATWRVNLEIVSSIDWDDISFDSISSLADDIKERVTEAVENYGETTSGLAHDYAMAFISDVHWYELAENVAIDYPALINQLYGQKNIT